MYAYVPAREKVFVQSLQTASTDFVLLSKTIHTK